MLNRSASLAMSTCVLKALPGKLDIKRHSPSILYFYPTLTLMLDSYIIYLSILFDFSEMTCPVNNTITNGKFLASCTGVTNVVCTFQCDRFFAPSLSPPQMKCLETGMWNENVFTACVGELSFLI